MQKLAEIDICDYNPAIEIKQEEREVPEYIIHRSPGRKIKRRIKDEPIDDVNPPPKKQKPAIKESSGRRTKREIKEKAIDPPSKKQKLTKKVSSGQGIKLEIKEEPVAEQSTKRSEKEHLQELFLSDTLEIDKDAQFRGADHDVVCPKCLKFNEAAPLVPCEGSCDRKLHKKCLKLIVESMENVEVKIKKYLCEKCHESPNLCCICDENLGTNIKNVSICKELTCSLRYHQKCLVNVSKNNKSCLKHFCHTCYKRDTSKKEPIVSCIECNMSYHGSILCIPAGSNVISRTQIICPRHRAKNVKKKMHINIDICTYCSCKGNLICCDTCPRAYHQECMSLELPEHDKIFKCDFCTAGVIPLYNTIVWAKVGNFRWWPGFVMVPWIAPEAIENQLNEFEFIIRFLGTHDYCLTTCERVYAYDDKYKAPKLNLNKRLDKGFSRALIEMKKLYKLLDGDESFDIEKVDVSQRVVLKSTKNIYKSIQICRPIPPVKLKKIPPEPCFCKETDEAPCTRENSCFNVAMFIECDESCPAGRKCRNQKVRNREHIELKIMKTKGRGFGAFCSDDIQPNTFIIEYIGELITNDELNRRLMLKKRRQEKEYYFFNVQNNMHIDAEFYSNKGRFINHSCEPNCDIQKVSVDGITRIGIFSNRFIKAGSELTFNYQMEFAVGFGIKCNCGASSCTGVIGKFSKPNN